MEIDRLPEWIVTRIERAPVGVEFVAEHEGVLLSVEACARVRVLGSSGVNKRRNVQVWDLACCIDASEIVSWTAGMKSANP